MWTASGWVKEEPIIPVAVFLEKYHVVEQQMHVGNVGGAGELHEMETHVGPSQQRDRMGYSGYFKMGWGGGMGNQLAEDKVEPEELKARRVKQCETVVSTLEEENPRKMN